MTGRSCRRCGLGSPQAAYVQNYGLLPFGVRVMSPVPPTEEGSPLILTFSPRGEKGCFGAGVDAASLRDSQWASIEARALNPGGKSTPLH